MVLYECEQEGGASEGPEVRRERIQWNKLCVRHADVIFILVDPTSPPAVTRVEDELEKDSARTRKEIIFLHKEDTKYPKGKRHELTAKILIATDPSKLTLVVEIVQAISF